MESFRDNPNPPRVRFIRVHGRVIPIVNNKKSLLGSKMISDRLEEMRQEVQHAERGMRGVGYNEHGEAVKNFATRSTFPPWYSHHGFKNKEQFYKTIDNLKSRKRIGLEEQAVEDLSKGYMTSFGRVPPSLGFKVVTRQVYDNRGVTFSRIDGLVRPMHFKKDEEVPF